VKVFLFIRIAQFWSQRLRTSHYSQVSFANLFLVALDSNAFDPDRGVSEVVDEQSM
jgi:hypothetical protein